MSVTTPTTTSFFSTSFADLTENNMENFEQISLAPSYHLIFNVALINKVWILLYYLQSLWEWTTNAKCSLSRIRSSFSRQVSSVTFLNVLYVAFLTVSVSITFPFSTFAFKLPRLATPSIFLKTKMQNNRQKFW